MFPLKTCLPIIAGLGLLAPASVESAWTSNKKLTVYHTNWATYGRNYQVADLPVDYISDVAYAFFNVKADGSVVSGDEWADYQKRFTGGTLNSVIPLDTWTDVQSVYGNFGQFMKLKANGKSFNFNIALGGWTWSTYWSNAVATSAARTTLVNAIVKLMTTYTFINGVSIDWEYISNNAVNYGNTGNVVSKSDDDNFALFIGQLRTAMSTAGLKNKSIQSCATAATDKMKFDAKRWGTLLDELHVMTYDFTDGAWGDAVASHQSNLYATSYTPFSVDAAVTAYINAGFPASKIMIGVAAYSRGFSNTAGIGKAASGASPDMSWEKGIVDYKALPESGATEYWDSAAQAGYSYDAARKVLNSYDTVQAAVAKCNYVKTKGLLGIIMWESSGDQPVTNSRSLVKAIYDCFHSDTTTAPVAAPAAAKTAAAATTKTTAKAAAASKTTTKASKAVATAAVSKSPSSSSSSSSSAACSAGTMKCNPAVSSAAFQVCGSNNDWVPMACASGTKCVQSGTGVYCDWA